MERLTIDRFEDEIAVCEREDQTMVDIPRSALPDGAGEGDVVFYNGINYTLDNDETSMRRERIEVKIDQLFKD